MDGSLSEKYFRVSDASAPARVRHVQVVQLVHDDHGHAGVQAYAAYRLDHVGDVGPAGNRQAEEPGDLHRDHLAGRGRRDGDVDDGDVVAGARVPVPVGDLGGLAELGDRRGLPGPGRPGHHEPGPPVMGEAVHPDQVPALGDDPPDDRGLDHDQPGVVLQPFLVVRGPLAVLEREPVLLGEQGRD